MTELLERPTAIVQDLVEFDQQFSFRPEISVNEASNHNWLIEGDNASVLKTLQSARPGSFRCVYLDPPYNNQETYSHYDDALDHETWLEAVAKRLELLPSLLTQDGSVWMSIDDREVHYLKVAGDSIFGRENFVTTIVWEQRTTRENRKVFSNNHEYVLVYAKNVDAFRESRNLLPPTDELLERYKNPDDDPRGSWQSVSATAQAGHATSNQFYTVVAPNGKRHVPPKGRCWVYPKHRMEEETKKNNIWFGRDGRGVPRLKVFLKDRELGLTPHTLWSADWVGTTNHAKKQLLQMFPDETVFDTPKPEPLIRQIIEIATNEGDWVLDPYAGSGTTAAVAQKLGRQFVAVEVGRDAARYAASRLAKVAAGEQSGISKELDWTGGGGFAYYEMED